MTKPAKDVVVHARVSSDIKNALEVLAEKDQRTVSFLIREAVANYIAMHSRIP